MTDPIRAKVARILNSRELIINRGSQSGVKMGMRFAVLDPAGENVQDPDTGEILGSVQRPKVQVEITQVSDKIAVARTYRSYGVNVGGVGSPIGDVARLFTPPQMVTRYETLKVEGADWEPLTEAQSIVKVGDPVVQIDISDEGQVGGVIAEDTEQTALPGSNEVPVQEPTEEHN